MANQELTLSMITNEALFILKNSLRLARYINRSYDKSFGQTGAKIGTVLNVRKPVRYIGGEGPSLTIEDFVETSAPLTLNRQPHVGIQFTSSELLLSVDEFSKRVLAPAVVNISNKVDLAVAQLYKLVWNTVGTFGTAPSTSALALNAGALLDDNAIPRDGARYIVLAPASIATIIPGLQGLFNPQPVIGTMYERGQMAQNTLGFDWDQDQNVVQHTVGALGGTPAVSSTNTSFTGNSLIFSGLTASITGIFKDGDIFTIVGDSTHAGVFMVNPQSRLTTNRLQQFTIVGDVDSDGSGFATVTFNPPITPSGAYQTVNAAAVSGAVISIFGVAQAGQAALAGTISPQGLAFHRDAFTLACADLPLPGGVDFAQRASDEDLGLSIRIVRQYSITSDQFPARLDLLFGCTSLRPEMASRAIG